jgi:hypothetical protein
MEARLNVKDFNRLETVKCAGRSHVMELYDSVGVHGSMWGVYAPMFLPRKRQAHGYALGKTCCRRNCACVTHTHVTSHPQGTDPSICFQMMIFGEQCRDIVSTSEGYGYALLHNIMRLVYPTLCDKVVGATITYQGNKVSFVAHARNMTQYFAWRNSASGFTRSMRPSR